MPSPTTIIDFPYDLMFRFSSICFVEYALLCLPAPREAVDHASVHQNISLGRSQVTLSDEFKENVYYSSMMTRWTLNMTVPLP